MIRNEVANFLSLGPLPTASLDTEEVKKFQNALEQIQPPLTDEEAFALLGSFGEDDCYGLAWTLVHLIETSPTPYPEEEPEEGDNFWLHALYQAYLNSLMQPE